MTTAVLSVLTAASCTPVRAPGMTVSSYSPSLDGLGAASFSSGPKRPNDPLRVLVAFPATACTSAESAVFLDEEGRFIGSVAPGTAASLIVRAESKHLFVVSSSDVTEAPRTWFLRHEVPRRSDQGVVIEVPRADGHNCAGKWSGPLALRPSTTTPAATMQATRGLTWLEVRASDGSRWLDENRARVNELVGRADNAAHVEPVVTTVTESR